MPGLSQLGELLVLVRRTYFGQFDELYFLTELGRTFSSLNCPCSTNCTPFLQMAYNEKKADAQHTDSMIQNVG